MDVGQEKQQMSPSAAEPFGPIKLGSQTCKPDEKWGCSGDVSLQDRFRGLYSQDAARAFLMPHFCNPQT